MRAADIDAELIAANPWWRDPVGSTRSGLQRHEGGWALPTGLLVYLLGS